MVEFIAQRRGGDGTDEEEGGEPGIHSILGYVIRRGLS
jgi:hypothetical protein